MLKELVLDYMQSGNSCSCKAYIQGSNIVVCEPVLVITAFIERKALEKKIQIHYQHFKNCLKKEMGFCKEENWSRTKKLIF